MNQFMEEYDILVINVNTRQLKSNILKPMQSLFMKEYVILVVNVTTKQQQRAILLYM